ncbi:hypothetical protein GBN24_03825 [Plesiomonas shigelloides]|uniref:hypothetical protein n=1 Tax=Plesiomonas shigelloides TaxID=703 RepID=UPI001261F388|nr:hypothetical protein [Plesiomonas shigelloides]KAB7693751.1 hypothetical protein GBN24_03825 [Plesiomonas shigelloides]
MLDDFLNDHYEQAYIRISDLLSALTSRAHMSNAEAFSYVYRLLKGSQAEAPLRVYEMPINPLPFDEFDEVEGIALSHILTELRDCAYRDATSCSIVDYVKRKALYRRLSDKGIDPCKLFPRENESQTEPQTGSIGRVSSASAIAIIALMKYSGLLMPDNLTRSADLLTSAVREAGFDLSYSRQTLTRWLSKVQELSSRIKAA